MKVRKCLKFGDLRLETAALVKLLKTENLTENVSESIEILDPMRTPTYSFFFFKKPH